MNSEEKTKDLDKRMKEAGMMSLTEMLKKHPGNLFMVHAEMSNLEFFREWLHSRHKEFLSMQAEMELNTSSETNELYEWIIAHAAVFGEVIANFDAAIKNN
jgi:hypothetical protein